MPTASPLSALYYGVSICLVAFATAMAVVTLNIHCRGLRGAEVPHKIKAVFLGVLAQILFLEFQRPFSKKTKRKESFHVPLNVSRLYDKDI